MGNCGGDAESLQNLSIAFLHSPDKEGQGVLVLLFSSSSALSSVVALTDLRDEVCGKPSRRRI